MKKQWVYRRIKFAVKQSPQRWWRLLTYYFHPFYQKPKFRALPLMLADCFWVFDIYEIISNLYKTNARPLTPAEILRGREVLGDSIDWRLVMLDTRATLLTRKLGVIYVSFNTINSWGEMRDDIFVHELVHIWQYQKFGAGYIANALVAQRTSEGYNYTQCRYLDIWHEADTIHLFNAEQQADLVQDFYRIKKGLKSDWGNHTKADLDKFERFINEIRLSQS